MPTIALGLLLGSLLQMQQATLWPSRTYLWMCTAAIAWLVVSGAVTLRARWRGVGERAAGRNAEQAAAAPGRRRRAIAALQAVLALAAAACLAYGAAGWRAGHRLADRLAPPLWGQVMPVEGVVESLPVRHPDSTRFVFVPLHLVPGMPARILVS
ncbi:MAG: hypothetical protein ACYC3R_07255, partial [Thiomonas delicata]